ncbi:MAG: DUF4912 domain-containing protein [Clostridia bacterium]|nr:DUF4912 domain-containing protein [Clostridia bacterium]
MSPLHLLGKTPQKKTTTKKTTTSNGKKVSEKKNTTSTTKNTAKKVTSKKIKTSPVQKIEYYDLPYRYNKTHIKLLAQTPNSLFIYWDISDKDRQKYIDEYGTSFFEETKPVLIIHNKTMNYSYEVEINDYANCWYLTVNDSNCKYNIELARKTIAKKNNTISRIKPFILISSSNDINSPNDRILFDKLLGKINFKDVKTNEIYQRDFPKFYALQENKDIYNIRDLYEEIYNDEDILNNTSSKFL